MLTKSEGGPGASGVQVALLLGENLQQVVGNDYDIIGFDPRGEPNTCFITRSRQETM